MEDRPDPSHSSTQTAMFVGVMSASLTLVLLLSTCLSFWGTDDDSSRRPGLSTAGGSSPDFLWTVLEFLGVRKLPSPSRLGPQPKFNSSVGDSEVSESMTHVDYRTDEYARTDEIHEVMSLERPGFCRWSSRDYCGEHRLPDHPYQNINRRDTEYFPSEASPLSLNQNQRHAVTSSPSIVYFGCSHINQSCSSSVELHPLDFNSHMSVPCLERFNSEVSLNASSDYLRTRCKYSVNGTHPTQNYSNLKWNNTFSQRSKSKNTVRAKVKTASLHPHVLLYKSRKRSDPRLITTSPEKSRRDKSSWDIHQNMDKEQVNIKYIIATTEGSEVTESRQRFLTLALPGLNIDLVSSQRTPRISHKRDDPNTDEFHSCTAKRDMNEVPGNKSRCLSMLSCSGELTSLIQPTIAGDRKCRPSQRSHDNLRASLKLLPCECFQPKLNLSQPCECFQPKLNLSQNSKGSVSPPRGYHRGSGGDLDGRFTGGRSRTYLRQGTKQKRQFFNSQSSPGHTCRHMSLIDSRNVTVHPIMGRVDITETNTTGRGYGRKRKLGQRNKGNKNMFNMHVVKVDTGCPSNIYLEEHVPTRNVRAGLYNHKTKGGNETSSVYVSSDVRPVVSTRRDEGSGKSNCFNSQMGSNRVIMKPLLMLKVSTSNAGQQHSRKRLNEKAIGGSRDCKTNPAARLDNIGEGTPINRMWLKRPETYKNWKCIRKFRTLEVESARDPQKPTRDPLAYSDCQAIDHKASHNISRDHRYRSGQHVPAPACDNHRLHADCPHNPSVTVRQRKNEAAGSLKSSSVVQPIINIRRRVGTLGKWSPNKTDVIKLIKPAAESSSFKNLMDQRLEHQGENSYRRKSRCDVINEGDSCINCPGSSNLPVKEQVVKQHRPRQNNNRNSYLSDILKQNCVDSHSSSSQSLVNLTDVNTTPPAYDTLSVVSCETSLSSDTQFVIFQRKANQSQNISENPTKESSSVTSLYLARVLSNTPTPTFYSNTPTPTFYSDSQQEGIDYTRGSTQQDDLILDRRTCHLQTGANILKINAKCCCGLSEAVFGGHTSRSRHLTAVAGVSEPICFISEDDQTSFVPQWSSCLCDRVRCKSSDETLSTTNIGELRNLRRFPKSNSTLKSNGRVRFKHTIEEAVPGTDEKHGGVNRGARHRYKKSTCGHSSDDLLTLTDEERQSSSYSLSRCVSSNTDSSMQSRSLTRDLRKYCSSSKTLTTSSWKSCGCVGNCPTTASLQTAQAKSKSQKVVSRHLPTWRKNENSSPLSIPLNGEQVSYLEIIPKPGKFKGLRLSELDELRMPTFVERLKSAKLTKQMKHNIQSTDHQTSSSSVEASVSPFAFTLQSPSSKSVWPAISNDYPPTVTDRSNTSCSQISCSQISSSQILCSPLSDKVIGHTRIIQTQTKARGKTTCSSRPAIEKVSPEQYLEPNKRYRSMYHPLQTAANSPPYWMRDAGRKYIWKRAGPSPDVDNCDVEHRLAPNTCQENTRGLATATDNNDLHLAASCRINQNDESVSSMTDNQVLCNKQLKTAEKETQADLFRNNKSGKTAEKETQADLCQKSEKIAEKETQASLFRNKIREKRAEKETQADLCQKSEKIAEKETQADSFRNKKSEKTAEKETQANSFINKKSEKTAEKETQANSFRNKKSEKTAEKETQANSFRNKEREKTAETETQANSFRNKKREKIAEKETQANSFRNKKREKIAEKETGANSCRNKKRERAYNEMETSNRKPSVIPACSSHQARWQVGWDNPVSKVTRSAVAKQSKRKVTRSAVVKQLKHKVTRSAVAKQSKLNLPTIRLNQTSKQRPVTRPSKITAVSDFGVKVSQKNKHAKPVPDDGADGKDAHLLFKLKLKSHRKCKPSKHLEKHHNHKAGTSSHIQVLSPIFKNVATHSETGSTTQVCPRKPHNNLHNSPVRSCLTATSSSSKVSVNNFGTQCDLTEVVQPPMGALLTNTGRIKHVDSISYLSSPDNTPHVQFQQPSLALHYGKQNSNTSVTTNLSSAAMTTAQTDIATNHRRYNQPTGGGDTINQHMAPAPLSFQQFRGSDFGQNKEHNADLYFQSPPTSPSLLQTSKLEDKHAPRARRLRCTLSEMMGKQGRAVCHAPVKRPYINHSATNIQGNNYSPRTNVQSSTNNYSPRTNVQSSTNNYSPRTNVLSSTNNYSPRTNVLSSTNNYSPRTNVLSSTNNYSPRTNVLSSANNYSSRTNVLSSANKYSSRTNVLSSTNNYSPRTNVLSSTNNYSPRTNILSSANNYSSRTNVLSSANNYSSRTNVLSSANNYSSRTNVLSSANNYSSRTNVLSSANNYSSQTNVLLSTKDYSSRNNILHTTSKYTSRTNVLPTKNNYNSRTNVLPPTSKYTSRTNVLPTKNNYTSRINVLPQTSSYTSPANVVPTKNNYTSHTNVVPTKNNYTSPANVVPTKNNYTSHTNVVPTKNNYTSPANVVPTKNNYTSPANVVPTKNNYTSHTNVVPTKNNYTSPANVVPTKNNYTSHTNVVPTKNNYTSPANVVPTKNNYTSHTNVVPTKNNYTSRTNVLPTANKYTSSTNILRKTRNYASRPKVAPTESYESTIRRTSAHRLHHLEDYHIASAIRFRSKIPVPVDHVQKKIPRAPKLDRRLVDIVSKPS